MSSGDVVYVILSESEDYYTFLDYEAVCSTLVIAKKTAKEVCRIKHPSVKLVWTRGEHDLWIAPLNETARVMIKKDKLL